ncbi:hypothetical protein K501DRAFT_266300 [Backusella circina FSU 941]|nr:hypothetical protein K501DRAFT_266300 [Backusella circina FSU 941]
MDFFRNLSEEGDDFPTTYSYSDEEFIDPEPPQGAPNCLQGRKIHFTGNFYGKSLDSMYELVTKYKGKSLEYHSKKYLHQANLTCLCVVASHAKLLLMLLKEKEPRC